MTRAAERGKKVLQRHNCNKCSHLVSCSKAVQNMQPADARLANERPKWMASTLAILAFASCCGLAGKANEFAWAWKRKATEISCLEALQPAASCVYIWASVSWSPLCEDYEVLLQSFVNKPVVSIAETALVLCRPTNPCNVLPGQNIAGMLLLKKLYPWDDNNFSFTPSQHLISGNGRRNQSRVCYRYCQLCWQRCRPWECPWESQG